MGTCFKSPVQQPLSSPLLSTTHTPKWTPSRRRCRRRWTGSKMSSCTRRRSSRPSPTSSTRPSPKCPVTETPRSVLELSLTSYLPCFFVYFLYNSHLRCNFYLDRHKLQL